MALPRVKPAELVGSPKPRVAPPTPVRSDVKELETTAKEIGLPLLPWQSEVGRYLYALGKGQQWLYPEVAVIVARQNGKTTILLPHIMRRLAMGRRILHAAQTRELPRKMFERLIPLVEARYPKARIRRGAGQETIELPNGGFYTISAATGGGPRGLSIDDLLPDELRELKEDFIAASLPTLMASTNPQTFYLSNAGSDDSKVLNAIRRRSGEDEALAYLEWSAAPERAADDPAGWAESNPSIGHFPFLMDNLTRMYRSHHLAGTMGHFETENLCRWVTSLREKLVDEKEWLNCKTEDQPGKPTEPCMAVSLSPDGKRASAAVAWTGADKKVWVRLLYDVTGDPIDTDKLGSDLRKTAMRLGVTETAFDPLTDPELVKYVKKSKSVTGNAYAAASSQFVNLVERGDIRWVDADAVTDDLTWTSRKPDGVDGAYHAVRAQDDRPITAALAAIRAVWLASGPKLSSAPRIR